LFLLNQSRKKTILRVSNPILLLLIYSPEKISFHRTLFVFIGLDIWCTWLTFFCSCLLRDRMWVICLQRGIRRTSITAHPVSYSRGSIFRHPGHSSTLALQCSGKLAWWTFFQSLSNCFDYVCIVCLPIMLVLCLLASLIEQKSQKACYSLCKEKSVVCSVFFNFFKSWFFHRFSILYQCQCPLRFLCTRM